MKLGKLKLLVDVSIGVSNGWAKHTVGNVPGLNQGYHLGPEFCDQGLLSLLKNGLGSLTKVSDFKKDAGVGVSQLWKSEDPTQVSQ